MTAAGVFAGDFGGEGVVIELRSASSLQRGAAIQLIAG
jgi:hypothetical protein